MALSLRKHLYDIREAIAAIVRFVHGQTRDAYLQDDLLQSAVERKCEIIGEALNRIRRADPTLLNAIRDHRSIISFRNILAHGYDSIDHRIVWDVITGDLHTLREDVERLLATPNDPGA